MGSLIASGKGTADPANDVLPGVRQTGIDRHAKQ